MDRYKFCAVWGYIFIVVAVWSDIVHGQRATDSFKCPQQFGYFRDGTDCNKYFICVFGDALHDKCTPGLYFNDELRMCDWPRNVKGCDGDAPKPGADPPAASRRQYGTTTVRPQSNRYRGGDGIPSINSIAPTQDSRTGSRYTPPITISQAYLSGSRNSTHFRPSDTFRPLATSTPRPYLYSTGAPASFKPVYYRMTPKPAPPVGPPRFSSNNKRKDYDESDYYDDEYEESSEENEPQLLVNQHLRGGNSNNLYIRPIKPTQKTFDTPTKRPEFSPRGQTSSSRDFSPRDPSSPSRTAEDPSRVGGRSFNSQSRGDSRTVQQQPRPAAPTHGSNVRSSQQRAAPVPAPAYNDRSRSTDSAIRLRPQAASIQSLDGGGESLDAQFGTNPRSISLPDRPYRLNSFDHDSDRKKAERSQQPFSKPKVTSTRFGQPQRPAYKTDDSSQSYDDDDYYYDDDDEEYDDDSDPRTFSPVPKVVIRLQKPPTTSTTTTTTTRRTTTRRPKVTTTRRPPTMRPAKRPLPFGISRPATKSPIRSGPKPLPRLPSRPQPVYSTPRPLVAADKCNSRNCVLPDCRCSSVEVPGGLGAREAPQIVLITFDDAVNDLNYELYTELFDGRRNPNGCPILGTFYVSHEWTDYGMVQSLYAKGHEMASHSITHSHGEKFSVNHWTKEIHGQREILHLYGGVKLEDVRGMRAPFLQVGGNNMFEMLYQANFTYDSSMPVLDNNPPFYPYTLDYNIGHECMIPPCPTKTFPGLWEVGMVMWNDYRGGRCSMGDACANPDNSEDVFKMLLKNFERHYTSNRAPFGLYYHAAWFTTQHYRRGYMKFIEYINSKDDVYIVTNWQALQWMREPTPLSHIKNFKPWQCPKDPEKPGPCHHPTSCNLNYKGGSRNLRTCQPCPSTFPWTGRTGFDEIYLV